MFKVPRKLNKINVMGVEVTIEINDSRCLDTSSLGMYSNGVIILRSKYEDINTFIDTFIHEATHALCDVLGTQFDDTLEEVLANTNGQNVAKIVSTLLTLGVFDIN